MGPHSKVVFAVVLASILACGALAQPSNERVLIRAGKPYTTLVNAIESQGGRVTYQYKYVDAIAAELPRSALAAISSIAGAGAVSKDLIVPHPAPVDTLLGRRLVRTVNESNLIYSSVQALPGTEIASLATFNPNAYLINNAIANTSPLHAAGVTGAGVIVAVIDSGIRPGFPHISLDGSVIGCEDFVGDALGCENFANSGHGTFVAGMISANVIFTFAEASILRQAVLAECPACFSNPPANTQIPMIGAAPLASIYALRVLPPDGGAPTSRVLAAVERVIELRERFDAGQADGVNIQVCNMSLGGATLFAGRDLFDTAVDVLLQKGIVPVIAAGNTGPATLTTASPASALTALTVGAASLAHNERIFWRAQIGPVLGALVRPFLGTQTAFFSSRGPNADGRKAPDVVANGFASYGQGFGATTGTINLASGTSLSAPSVAGVAALLRQAFPGATARQIRNAISMAANPNLLADGSTDLDRGNGYVDAVASGNLLAAGAVPDLPASPGRPVKSVGVNVMRETGLRAQNGLVRQRISDLKPGQRYDILYEVLPNTRQVVIHLENVTPSLPPGQQNQLFGDDILLAVHSAKTSAIGAEGDYAVFDFTTGGTFVVTDPETGILRVSVNGDWTNAGTISADVTVFYTAEPVPRFTETGKIADGQLMVVPVSIPPGTGLADFRLRWREDWGRYPTNDIDLILVDPTGALNFAGATLNNPEFVRIENPMAGTWAALIHGFEIHTGDDRFEFRVALDGNVVR